MSAASFVARSRVTFPCKDPRNSNLLSIRRPLALCGCPFRSRSCCVQTESSADGQTSPSEPLIDRFVAPHQSFADFELAGWEDESTAAQYDKHVALVTTQSVEALLDDAQLRSGHKVLDVATGPGYVA